MDKSNTFSNTKSNVSAKFIVIKKTIYHKIILNVQWLTNAEDISNNFVVSVIEIALRIYHY